MNLIKQLPRIAARVLHNTHTLRPDMKFKLELLSDAYGEAAVLDDFEAWCGEHQGDHFKYPIFEYLKVIDSRLGGAAEEKRADLKDPRVIEMVQFSYEQTGVLPKTTSVAELVLNYPLDEIKAALVEYTENLTEKEFSAASGSFYANGGIGAVSIILARRRRTQHGKN
jgi:hypothetical protein